jgi:hypothetical protein
MKRRFKAFITVLALAALALTLTLALPASAGAKTGEVLWVCDSTVFVSAPTEARNGIDTANAHAGVTFNLRFNENCVVRP